MLLIAAAVLLVVGTSLERSNTATETQERASMAERPQGEAGEELFGVNPESVGLMVTVAVVSLLLAALLLAVAGRQVLLAVMAFALVFAALDVREGVHQASETRPSRG